MKKKNLNLTRMFFIAITLIILAIVFFIKDSNIKKICIAILLVVALIILDIKMPKIANLSKDNPKVKTMRKISRLSMIIVLGAFFAELSPIKSSFSQRANEIIVIGIISLFMMIFGNSATKIPLNRNVGLRLPWTVRDEETWKIAHRILGYISFPIAILQFVLVFFLPAKIIGPTCIISWVLIPGVYSLWFFYKKFKDFNKLD